MLGEIAVNVDDSPKPDPLNTMLLPFTTKTILGHSIKAMTCRFLKLLVVLLLLPFFHVVCVTVRSCLLIVVIFIVDAVVVVIVAVAVVVTRRPFQHRLRALVHRIEGLPVWEACRRQERRKRTTKTKDEKEEKKEKKEKEEEDVKSDG